MHQYKEIARSLEGVLFTLNQANLLLCATRPDEGAQLWEAARMIGEVRKALTGATAAQTPKGVQYNPGLKKPQCRGDVGLVRKALWECGWEKRAKCFLFSDKHKNWSRVKVWFANDIFDAPQEQQEALAEALREAFGDRIIKMGFIKHWTKDKSLCIWLKP